MPTLDKTASAKLDTIAHTFGLNETELADLFGIRRPSVAGWREHGIPPTRTASVERLLDLARIFQRELLPERIPQIVRTPDAWLDNKTILETIRRAGVDPIHAYLARLFSYNGA